MKCKKCGSSFKGKKCPKCGANVPSQNISLIFAIIQALSFIGLGAFLILDGAIEESFIPLFCALALVFIILGIFSRKHMWANVVMIVLSSVLGSLGLIGGILGLYKLNEMGKALKKEGEALKANEQQQEEGKTTVTGYQFTSSLLEQLADENNHEHVLLHNDDIDAELEKVYVTYIDNKLYCALKTIYVNNQLVEEQETIVFSLEEDSQTGEHKLTVVSDEMAEIIHNEYVQTVSNEPFEANNVENNNAKKKDTILDKIVNKLKSDKPDNAKKGVFITLTVLYSLLLVLSIVIYFTNFFSVFKGEEQILWCKSISLFVLACIPSYLIYLSFSSPYSEKISHVAMTVIAILLHIGLFALFVIQGRNLFEIASASALVLLLFALCAATIIATDIFYCKSKDIHSVIKLFIPILALICSFIVIVGVLIYLIILFVKVLLSFLLPLFGDTKFGQAFKRGYNGEDNPPEQYEINDGGYTRVLTYYDYYNGHNRYKDDVGNYWRSDDNGKTFYRE